jgi:hypothetical protein
LSTDGPITPAPGRLVRLGVVLPDDPAAAARLAHLCDLAGIDVVWAADAGAAARLPRVERVAVELVPTTSPPWSRVVAVSIGRTSAEAEARAGLDPAFPAGAVVGTLEEVQAAVVALAHAGVTDLRCVLPDAPDVQDVVAQLTAVAVGDLDTHRPDAPRSPDPPPPPWAAR